MTLSLPNSRATAWSIWMIASVFYAYQYILRVMPNIMLGDIMQQFHIDAASFGQFSGVYYIGYSLLHLPVGIMLDRFGPRKMMTACILLTVVGLTPLLFAEHWVYPVIGRFLIGLGSSAAILGVFKIIRLGFKEERFSRMLSLSVTIGLVGAIYGGGPVNLMRTAFGYQTVVEIFAFVGIALAAITYWIVPDQKSAPQRTVLSDLKEVLSNPKVILSCLFAGLMVGPLEGFADVWGTAFLKQVYGLDANIASSFPSMIFVGMCFGSPLLSMISEKMGSPLIAIFSAGVAMTASFGLLLAFHLSPAMISLTFLFVGACSAYQILAIYKASTYVSEHVAGLTTAVANMIIMIFGYGFHTTMGAVIEASGGPGNSQALMNGIMVIPAALCLGTCGFLYLFKREQIQRMAH